MRCFSIIIILNLLCGDIAAQKSSPYYPPGIQDGYSIKTWLTEDGLPQNAVMSITQDSKGYLWIGTQNGAVKFDGTKFNSANLQRKFPTLTRYVTEVYEDRKRNIWISTSGGGIVLLEKSKETLFTTDDGLYSNYCGNILHDSKDRVWIKTLGGLNYFFKGKIYRASEKNNSPLIMTPEFEDSEGRVWFIDSNGKIIIKHENEYRPYENDLIKNKMIDVIFQDKQRRIWAADSIGLYLLSGEGKSVFKFSITPMPIGIKKIAQDNNGNLWLASTIYGVYLFKDGKFYRFSVTEGLSDNLIGDVFVDREDNIWVGTYGGGLNRINKKFIETISTTNGLPNDFLFSVQQDQNGNLWVGSYGSGLIKFDGKQFFEYSRTTDFPANVIRSVLIDTNEDTFIGTYGAGVALFDLDKQSVSIIIKELPDGNIHALFEDSKKNYWIGTGKGFVKLTDGKIFSFDSFNKGQNNIIRSFAEDREGNIWIATDISGVVQYDGSEFKKFDIDDGLPSNSVKDIFLDSSGLLWFSTVNGLSVYNGKKFSVINFQSDFANGVIYAALEDLEKNIWCSTNNGIFQLKRIDINSYLSGKTKSVFPMLFNKSDGMINSECNGGNKPSGILTKEGKIIFPTIKGLAIIDPGKISKSAFQSINIIERFVVDENEIDFNGKIELRAGTNKFEISYSSPCLSTPERIQFRYILEGYDNDWINAGTRRTAFYNKIPPGEYKFKLISCGNNGTWDNNPVELIVTIEPYFYQTIWFYILICVLIIGGLFLYLHIRHRKIIVVQKKLQILVEEKTKSLNEEKKRVELAFAEIEKAKTELDAVNQELINVNKLKTDLLNMAAHDLRNPLNVIKSCCDLVLDEPKLDANTVEPMELIKRSSNKMLDLIEDVLKTAHHESKKLSLHCREFDISKLLETVIANFKNLSQKKNQNILFNTPGEILITADETKLEDVFSNLLSNAIKYSPFNKNIYVELNLLLEIVEVRLRDEGPGLTEDDKKKIFGKFEKLSARPTGEESSIGLGLSIVKDLIELHNGHIRVESELGKGTVFVIALPIKSV
ncbi:MAG: two-component regulator propeller domain-containing protein [bacterium]